MEDAVWFSHYSTFEEDKGASAPILAQTKDPRFSDDSVPVYSRDLLLYHVPGLKDFQICDWGEDRWPKGRGVKNRTCDRMPTLHFVIGGTGLLNGTPIQAGSAFLIDPNRPYSISSLGEEALRYCWIRVRTERSFFEDLNLFTYGEDGCGRFDFSPCLQGLIRLHRKGQRLDGSGWFLALSLNSLFFEILSRCLRAAPVKETQSAYVTRALAFIRAHYAEDINVNSLAESLHVSRNHLRRLFLRDLGLLPKDQIVKCRMEAAALRLQQENAPSLAQLAAEVGYPSYSQFIRAFRKTYGCSPKEFRGTLE